MGQSTDAILVYGVDLGEDELPVTLPVGTRTLGNCTFVSEAKLAASPIDGGPVYHGSYRYDDSLTVYESGPGGACRAARVDWSSYTPPKPAEAPKLCAACGGNAAPEVWGDAERSGFQKTLGFQFPLGSNGITQKIEQAIARRKLSPSAVAGETKRFGESEEICASCSEGGCFREQPCDMAGNGKWYCEACIDGAREQHGVSDEREEPAAVVVKSPCSGCGAPSRLRGKLCVYCSDSTSVEGSSRESVDASLADGMANEHANPEAAARLAKWSLADTRRSVGNPTERRELSKPHPWIEFDELESR